MSQKIRIGNVYQHNEYGEIVTVYHDDKNEVYFREVQGRDNAGVISASEALHSEPYKEMLGNVQMRDYPDDGDWQALREVVLERDNYTCQGCGSDVESSAQIHHIVPLGCGGTNTRANLISLCEECHGRVHGGSV